eukprot:GHUV01026371.1.p2 GENE.GHUV01026371.1~~GHUV01026371.1.p2  ORF type:complete len:104 (+),score=23.43 GHUV01026371.1:685-996(+)
MVDAKRTHASSNGYPPDIVFSLLPVVFCTAFWPVSLTVRVRAVTQVVVGPHHTTSLRRHSAAKHGKRSMSVKGPPHQLICIAHAEMRPLSEIVHHQRERFSCS